MIGCLASTSKILASFLYVYAQTGRQFFIGPIIELLKEAGFISMRSISSKLVKSDELVNFAKYHEWGRLRKFFYFRVKLIL